MQSVRELIDAYWPTPEKMAIELGYEVGQARHWKTRDALPAKHWPKVVKAARRKGWKGDERDLAKWLAAKSNGKATST